MQKSFTTAIAILFLVSSGLACSPLRPKTPFTWHLILELDQAVPDRAMAVSRTISVIERRLDAADIDVSKVTPEGAPENGRIRVSLPDVADRKRLTDLITSEGRLELVAVVSPPNPNAVQTFSNQQEALASLGGNAPDNRRVLPYNERDEATVAGNGTVSGQSTRWVVVENPAVVDGSELQNAQARPTGINDGYHIGFSLRPGGAQKFGAWTGANINNYLGVVLNGKVKSIAFIQSQIYDQGEISGRFTKQAAEDLALILRTGALPAPVKIVETGNSK
ncbi:MAG TPA: hypothetical protein VNO50_01170 [Pyrinomonadaceae bacterium]|nr:hypothetical protein [Pyrinomonadaceae bacterium]